MKAIITNSPLIGPLDSPKAIHHPHNTFIFTARRSILYIYILALYKKQHKSSIRMKRLKELIWKP